MSSEAEIRPFRVDMPDEAVTDLRRRIAATRWPSPELVADRSQGVQLATIRELAPAGSRAQIPADGRNWTFPRYPLVPEERVAGGPDGQGLGGRPVWAHRYPQ
jgi:hypothetical protein